MFDEEVESKALVVSNYIRQQPKYIGSNNIQTIFESLGIPFKKIKNKTFWLANEADLEYLYHDFCKASREVLAELHPDKGGDHNEFVEFIKQITLIKKAFYKHGVKSDTIFKAIEREEKQEKRKEQSEHLKNLNIVGGAALKKRKSRIVTPESKEIVLEDLKYFDKWQNCFCMLGYSRPEDMIKAGQMILDGYGTRATASAMNFSRTTMARLKKLLLDRGHVIKGCPCGRPSGHQGNCHHRLNKIGRDHLDKFIKEGENTRYKKGNAPDRWKKRSERFNFEG